MPGVLVLIKFTVVGGGVGKDFSCLLVAEGRERENGLGRKECGLMG